MRKINLRCMALALVLSLLFPASACAADITGQDPETVQQAGALLYVPDHSVYFADVADGYNWAFREIDYLANAQVISGTGKHIFSPAKPLTRADFILMLYRAYDMEKYTGGEQFADVSADAYYADALRAARALGIAAGDANGCFHPADALTRQDAMVLLRRTLDRTGLSFAPGDLSAFSDRSQVAAYAGTAVGSLVRAGVIGGSDGKLAPARAVTRAEMAIMLYRALHLQADVQGARYIAQPEIRMACVGSTLYADVEIADYDDSRTYAGLFELQQLQEKDGAYTAILGDAVSMDDVLVWDGTTLTVNGTVMKVAPDCEAIETEPYAKRTAGLCSTGDGYTAAAVSVQNGLVQTVYYRK